MNLTSTARPTRTVLIIGSGAIGRGYLPWLLDSNRYRLIFVDSNETLIATMRTRGRYGTWRARGGALESKSVPIDAALLPQELDTADFEPVEAVFVQVGPRNVASVGALLQSIRCPIILNENDPATVAELRNQLPHARIFFGVPDVITSNTAPDEMRHSDPLAIVTEDGELFVDAAAKLYDLAPNIRHLAERELLGTQWTAKLYIHNTPHCVAAYLGALAGVTYLHEAMRVPKISEIVTGCMNEMLTSLKLTWDIPHEFLDWYAAKELERFRNPLLFDPISRVAREPLRKLALDGRLIGAANICIAQGFIPSHLLAGIVGALQFRDEDDNDRQLLFLWDHLDRDALFTDVLGLRKGEALEMVLQQRLARIVGELELLSARR